jgi:hypothetical protein
MDRDIEQRVEEITRDVAEIFQRSTSCIIRSAERLNAIEKSAKRSQEIDNGILRSIASWRSREAHSSETATRKKSQSVL